MKYSEQPVAQTFTAAFVIGEKRTVLYNKYELFSARISHISKRKKQIFKKLEQLKGAGIRKRR